MEGKGEGHLSLREKMSFLRKSEGPLVTMAP